QPVRDDCVTKRRQPHHLRIEPISYRSHFERLCSMARMHLLRSNDSQRMLPDTIRDKFTEVAGLDHRYCYARANEGTPNLFKGVSLNFQSELHLRALCALKLCNHYNALNFRCSAMATLVRSPCRYWAC